eukprot:TRINITY_DN309_c0_g1_i1.p1 TRINITY_DN309_c0_g1~~TRINITY_DN309_c0_g1_i1.p1  ORF type:complete len:438 (-),score=131.86 TRINITY_DN309_c0_g1_i1:108-1421(-)
MANVNIGGNNNDASYRYKMPRIQTKVEGRGNGIKTVVVNMTDIAKALHVDPDYPTKFFGTELGAQSKFDKKLERAIVNGCHDAPKLAELLDKFIDMFILCPVCRLPEIIWQVDLRREIIRVDCAACGNNSTLTHNHKLVTYILKNPPAVSKKSRAQTTEKPSKKKAGKKGQAAEETAEEGSSDPASGHLAHIAGTSNPMGASLLNSESRKEDEDDVQWYTDTSKEAQQERRAAELQAMGMEVVERVAEGRSSRKEKETPSAMLRRFIAAEPRTTKQILAELRRIQLARNLDEPHRCKILVEAIFDVSQPKTIVTQIATQAPLLKQLAHDRIATISLLGAFEEYCGVTEAEKLLPRIPLILQALYDNDIMSEETLVSWYDSPPEISAVRRDVAVLLRQKAEPFIKWLQTADSDEDDDDEEDGDEDDEEEEEEESDDDS